MTAQFPALAAQNVTLLRAIQQGPAASLTELGERSGVGVTNLNRKLASLAEAGLIAKAGEASHQVELTEAAQLALQAITVFEQGGLPLAPAEAGMMELDPTLIDDNPWQPRTSYDASETEEMARSVADKGILQPILVRAKGERFEQALGHRRKLGALLARERGWVPADFRVRVEVRALSDEDMEEIALVENVQRSDLHWMDEAEAYLRLATRPHNALSAAGIKRLVGEKNRSKRSIQELIQYARELDAEQKRKARLPEGDPERLSYEQCRYLVGSKKAKPALDLNAKAACALVELLDAGEVAEGEAEVSVRLHVKPTTRELVTLGDKGLVQFKVAGSTPIAVVKVTEAVASFLEQIQFHDDREACLAKVRAEVMGELSAGALAVDGRYALAELNMPEPEAEPEPEPAPAHGGTTLERLQAAVGGTLVAPGQPDLLDPPPAAPSAAELAADHMALAPSHGLTVLELAHKLQREGQDRASGRTVAVGAYHRDNLSQELVFARLVMFAPMGTDNGAALTARANTWLDQQDVERDADGVAQVSDEALLYRQAQLGCTPARGIYATAWLNPEPATRGEGAPPRDAFAEQVLSVAREAAAEQDHAPNAPAAPREVTAAERALQSLSAASREAERAMRSATTRAKLKADEFKAVLELLNAALELADAALKAAAAAPVSVDTQTQTMEPADAEA